MKTPGFRLRLLLLVLVCAGCSTWPEQTAAPSMIGAGSYETIGAGSYETMSCEELRSESKRLLTITPVKCHRKTRSSMKSRSL